MAKKKISRARKTRPKFKKFCPDCVFLVNYNGMDLYYCPHRKHGASYVVQYGAHKCNSIASDGNNPLIPSLQISNSEQLQVRH